MKRALLIALLCAFCVVMLVPWATATHTYGHRYIVLGRVLDGAGMPVQEEDVLITMRIGDHVQASVVTRTDCKGDFISYEGQLVAGNMYEVRDGRTYFHYHDPELSRSIDVDLNAVGESWQDDFDVDTRYTFVRHALTGLVAAKSTCGGNYDEFNQTFRFDVVMTTEPELQYLQEDVVDPRPVEMEMRTNTPPPVQTVETDANGRAVFSFPSEGLGAGTEVRVFSAEVGNRTLTLSDDDARYHRADEFYLLGEDPGQGFLQGALIFGAVLGGAALLVGAFIVVGKVRDRAALSKAYETTTRKRARRKS